jgi:hypothetical protein
VGRIGEDSIIAFIISHTNDILSCVFWGLVGIALLSPIMLVGSAYGAATTPSRYHFRGFYHHKRRFYLRRMGIYATLLCLCMACAGFFLLVSWVRQKGLIGLIRL